MSDDDKLPVFPPLASMGASDPKPHDWKEMNTPRREDSRADADERARNNAFGPSPPRTGQVTPVAASSTPTAMASPFIPNSASARTPGTRKGILSDVKAAASSVFKSGRRAIGRLDVRKNKVDPNPVQSNLSRIANQLAQTSPWARVRRNPTMLEGEPTSAQAIRGGQMGGVLSALGRSRRAQVDPASRAGPSSDDGVARQVNFEDDRDLSKVVVQRRVGPHRPRVGRGALTLTGLLRQEYPDEPGPSTADVPGPSTADVPGPSTADVKVKDEPADVKDESSASSAPSDSAYAESESSDDFDPELYDDIYASLAYATSALPDWPVVEQLAHQVFRRRVRKRRMLRGLGPISIQMLAYS